MTLHTRRFSYTFLAATLCGMILLGGCTNDSDGTSATPAADAGAPSTSTAPTTPNATANVTAGDSAIKPYPLDVCIVSGESLGGMGKPVVMTYEGQEFKLCCAGCKGEFEANPAMYLAQLAKAVVVRTDADVDVEVDGDAAVESLDAAVDAGSDAAGDAKDTASSAMDHVDHSHDHDAQAH